MRVRIPFKGSWQNPAWAPTGRRLSVTCWHSGYNKSPADVYRIDPAGIEVPFLVTHDQQGATNCSQPGSCWHANGKIIFSSTKVPGGNDWPCTINAMDGKGFEPLFKTGMEGYAGYEPTFAPNGIDFAFERHVAGDPNHGEIIVVRNGVGLRVSNRGDSRQPCWGPKNSIVYQVKGRDGWNAWVWNGVIETQITSGIDATDITWHPHGERLLFSSDGGLYEIEATREAKPKLLIPAPEGHYIGAPSWSPDGSRIACECGPGDPDESGVPTWIEIYDVPVMR